MPLAKLRSAKEDVLTEPEAIALLRACSDLLDNLVVRIPLYAGLRIGEVQHLKKSWLDWDKGEKIREEATAQARAYIMATWEDNQ